MANIPVTDTDRQVAQVDDVQLSRVLHRLSPVERTRFANSATGMFAERVKGTLRNEHLATAPAPTAGTPDWVVDPEPVCIMDDPPPEGTLNLKQLCPGGINLQD